MNAEQQKRVFFLGRMNDHVQYLNKIKATLNGTGDFQGTDCHYCALGKWIYGEGSLQAELLGDRAQALFTSLEAIHARFHQVSAQALTYHHTGDEVGQYRAMTEMYQLSNQLIQMLLDLDRLANRHSHIA